MIKYIMFDRDANEWNQMESLEMVKADLNEKCTDWGMGRDGTTSKDMEMTIIKVPPNSKATEITLTMEVKRKWEINEGN